MQFCESTFLFAFLALLYSVLSLAILLSIHRLRSSHAASPSAVTALPSFALSSPTSLSFSSSSLHQQLFLACALLECILRFLYFLLYPLLSAGCQPLALLLPASPHAWLNALGHLPTCLLLLCLSVLCYSLARIYHILLLAGGKRQRVRLYLLSTLLVTLNAVVVVAEVGEWAPRGVFGGRAAYVVAGGCAVMGVLLFRYGYLLFHHVQAVLELSVASSHTPASPAASTPYRPTAPLAIHRQVAPLPMNGMGSLESGGSSTASSSGGASHSPVSYIPVWRTGGSVAEGGESAVSRLVEQVQEEQQEAWDETVEYDGHDSFSYSDSNNTQLTFSPTALTPSTAPAHLSTTSSPALRTSSFSPTTLPPPSPLPATTFLLTPPPNPLRRLAVLSALVTLCLWLRSAVLLLVVLMLGGVWGVASTVLYWSVGEVLPLVLMLRLMEGERSGGSGEAARVEQRPVVQHTAHRQSSGQRVWAVL